MLYTAALDVLTPLFRRLSRLLKDSLAPSSSGSSPGSKAFYFLEREVLIMFPKVNPRQMKRMMRQLGMEMEELNAKEVIIRLEDREIVISNPQVSVVRAMNQKTYQVVGEEKEVPLIPEEDVALVAEQAGVSKEEAQRALKETGGDLAEAIMKLKG
jgi:nascent polypeptide-associated complex subunit alpha